MKTISSSLIASLLAISALSACNQTPLMQAPLNAQRQASQNLRAPLAAFSSNTAKPESNAVKSGTSELQARESKGQPKASAPVSTSVAAPGDNEALASRSRGSLSPREISALARIGLQSMDRTRTYDDGFRVGYQSLQELARENSYIARLAMAASSPQMKYESAYKAVAHALTFIAEGRDISVRSAVILIRQMMNSAKTWDDGTQMGYATIDFISQTAQPGMRTILQATKRSAQSTRYWEDSYKIIYDAYGQLQDMNY